MWIACGKMCITVNSRFFYPNQLHLLQIQVIPIPTLIKMLGIKAK